MDASDLREAVRQVRTKPTPDQMYAQLQQAHAELGTAAGQCSGCGSYRSDGLPPVLHRDGCSHGDDWKADPLGMF